MRFFRKAAIHLFWIFAIWYALQGMSVTAAGPVEGVHYDKQTEMLTVHVYEMPLNEILRTISTASGFKLSMQAGLNRSVTMNFTAVPLDEAIHRLVRPNSSAMIYSKKEDGAIALTSVRIFDNGETLSSSLPEVTGRRNRSGGSSHDSNDRAVGNLAQSIRESLMDQNSNGRNRRNRHQRGADAIASGSGSQKGGAIGETGSQSPSGTYSSGDERSNR